MTTSSWKMTKKRQIKRTHGEMDEQPKIDTQLLQTTSFSSVLVIMHLFWAWGLLPVSVPGPI